MSNRLRTLKQLAQVLGLDNGRLADYERLVGFFHTP